MSLVRASASMRPAGTPGSLPAPVGGWNARDSLDAMAPIDAIVMDNYFPGTDSVESRRGFIEHAFSAGGTVETLADFHSGTTEKLISAAAGTLWDVTTANSVPVSLATGFASNRWQYVNFNGSMGLVNGSDAPQVFDGSTMSNMTVSGSGLTVANLIGIAAYQNRTYFWEDDSQDFWYSATNALGGTLTKFQLSRVGQFGGKLVNVIPWTIGGAATPAESGVSLQQVICFVMSSGEVIVYRGSDPGDATDWALVGVYRTGAPLGIRGSVALAGDAVILTWDGAMPMSAVMQQGQFSPANAITDKIRKAFNTAAREYSANDGWEAIFYPGGPWYLVNVPISATQSHQYIMNTITGAWCRFLGMNARSWCVHQNRIFFGSVDGRVYQADTGLFDTDIENWDEITTLWENWETPWGSSTDSTVNITGEVRQAFSAFNTPYLKHVTAVRPSIVGDGDLRIGFIVEADFRDQGVPSSQTALAGQFIPWDAIATNWDEWTEPWGTGAGQVISPWLLRSARGVMINTRLASSGQQSIKWYSTNFRFISGSGL